MKGDHRSIFVDAICICAIIHIIFFFSLIDMVLMLEQMSDLLLIDLFIYFKSISDSVQRQIMYLSQSIKCVISEKSEI